MASTAMPLALGTLTSLVLPFLNKSKLGSYTPTMATPILVSAAVLGLSPLSAPVGRVRRYASALRRTRGVPVSNPADAPAWDGQGTLRVVSWNIQYCAGIEREFFYDGGRAVSTDANVVEAYATSIGDALAALNPDVVLLQEVDRRSRRTHKIDQLDRIGRCLPELRSRCSAAYWRVPYVPSPKWEHVGRIGMHSAVISRYRLGKGTRTQLPLLREKWYRKFFNLRRALLDVEMAVESGEGSLSALHLLNTHLSAFSGADDTLSRQVAELCKRAEALNAKGSPWLLAGDFNALPVASTHGLGEYSTPAHDPRLALANDAPREAEYYALSSPLRPLFESGRAVVDASAHASDPRRWHTYKPFHEEAPVCAIDHAFSSKELVVTNVEVVQTGGKYLSDHQPLLIDFQLK